MSNQANEERMLEETMQQLSRWVLDDGKVVTSSYLLKSTALNVLQVQRLMKEFVDQYITDGRITLTFLLLGEIYPDYDEADGIERLKSTICRQEEFEQVKGQFKTIHTCSIYSVQARAIRDFQSLFNVDWGMESSPVKNKSLIWNSAAYDFYTKWHESRQDDVNRLEGVSKHLLQKEMLRNAAMVGEGKVTNEKAREGKTPYSIFKSEGDTSPGKKQVPVADSTVPSPQTKRRRGILIDNEEDKDEDSERREVEEKLQADLVLPQCETIGTNKHTSSGPPLNLMGNDANDLYCTGGDSSPEKECVKPSKNSKPLETKKFPQGTKKLQQLLAKSEVVSDEEDKAMSSAQKDVAGQPQDQKSKAITWFRHEKMTDTYVDEDGFTVMRTVPKLVETEELVAVRPSSQRKVLKASNTVNSKSSKLRVAPGQSTISSFFTKK